MEVAPFAAIDVTFRTPIRGILAPGAVVRFVGWLDRKGLLHDDIRNARIVETLLSREQVEDARAQQMASEKGISVEAYRRGEREISAALDRCRTAIASRAAPGLTSQFNVTFRGEQRWTVEGDSLVIDGYVTLAHAQAASLRGTGGYTCRYDMRNGSVRLTVD